MSPLDEVFFFEANEDTIADDDVIENFDTDDVSCLDKLFRSSDVFLTGFGIAGWMVVCENYGIGCVFYGKFQNLTGVEYTRIECSLEDLAFT